MMKLPTAQGARKRKSPPALRGKALARTRGKGKKVGLKKPEQKIGTAVRYTNGSSTYEESRGSKWITRKLRK